MKKETFKTLREALEKYSDEIVSMQRIDTDEYTDQTGSEWLDELKDNYLLIEPTDVETVGDSHYAYVH